MFYYLPVLGNYTGDFLDFHALYKSKMRKKFVMEKKTPVTTIRRAETTAESKSYPA